MGLTPNELLTNRSQPPLKETDLNPEPILEQKFDPNGTPEFPSRTKRNLAYHEIVNSLRESNIEFETSSRFNLNNDIVNKDQDDKDNNILQEKDIISELNKQIDYLKYSKEESNILLKNVIKMKENEILDMQK